jgi:hypothetical protein
MKLKSLWVFCIAFTLLRSKILEVGQIKGTFIVFALENIKILTLFN